MKFKTRIYQGLGLCSMALGALLVMSSCNKEYPNILKEFGPQPDYTSGSSKVLFIVADGVRGKAMQALELPNFRIIARNSLYSFGSLGDYNTGKFTREMGLANLFTGVTKEKHQVSGNDLTAANTTGYPSLLSRMREAQNTVVTTTISADAVLSSTFFADADTQQLVADDAAVLSTTIEALTTGNADFVVSHLSDPYKVGLAHSFEAEDQQYKEALTTLDSQVGELIDAIKSRSTFKQENWLVVISSSIGGAIANDAVDNTQYGDNERNTFTYFYSPNFTRSLLSRPNSTEIPFDGSAVRYTYSGTGVNAILEDAEAFKFANNTDDFSINFFIKSNVTGSYNYPIILSKRDRGFGGNGWNLFFEVRDGNNKIGWNSNISDQIFASKQVNDGKWHSFTVTVNRSGAADSVKVFMDGVLNNKALVHANSLNNEAPLVIGKKAGDDNANPDVLIANLQIFNATLSEAEVAQYAGNTLIDASHPRYGNLIGYWPGYNDVGSNKLTDYSGGGHDMQLTGNYNWTTYSDIVSYFKPPITSSFYKLVPNSVDLPFFIYQWFGIVPHGSWELEGKSWTPSLIVSAQ